jgi:O-antigen/teichoic acid export membrane protein
MRVFFSKGILAVFDQGLFTGSNFIITILLGRWLTQESYGAYSVAMVVFLFVSGIYVSFILEPMSVLGPSEFKDDVSGYYRFLINSHLIVTILLSILVLIASYLIYNLNYSALRVMAIVLPMTLAIWLVRRYFYMQGNPGSSLLVSIVYSVILVVGFFIMAKFSFISENNIFVLIGIASLLPSLFVMLMNYKTNNIPINYSLITFSHWDFGKWIGLASILNWAAIQIYTVFVVLILDLKSAGGLKSIQNFAQPLYQISAALSLLLIPLASRFLVEKSLKKYKFIVSSVNWFLIGLGLIYLLIIWIWREPLFDLVYGGKYLEYSELIPYIVVVPIIYSLSLGAQIGIRATRKPKKLMYAYLVTACATLSIGPILINYYGLKGAIIGMIVTAIIFSLSTNVLYFLIDKGIMNE